MILEVIIDNANAVSAAVTTALATKKAELVANLIAQGMDSTAADAGADMQMEAVKIMASYVFFQETKCILRLDSDTNGIAVIGDDVIESSEPVVIDPGADEVVQ